MLKVSCKLHQYPISEEAKLHGALFEPKDLTGLVYEVSTEFFVDHEESIEALKMVQETWKWPLEDLLDGHEFLLILLGKHCQSRSCLSSKSEKGVFSGC